jgi:hypothetical protein
VAAAEQRLQDARREVDQLTSGLGSAQEAMRADIQVMSRQFLEVITELAVPIEQDTTMNGTGTDMLPTHTNTTPGDTLDRPAELPEEPL